MGDRKPENPPLFEGESPGRLHTEVTLRDLFAAAALVAAGNPVVPDSMPTSEVLERLASGAYMVADAMLAEREERS